MTITCEVTPEDHDYVTEVVSKYAVEELKLIRLTGLSFVFGITLFLSHMFFDYEHDLLFRYIGLPISLLITFLSHLYISSDLRAKKITKSAKERSMRGHLGRNTFTIEPNGLRESNERGEHFTRWKFIDDIQVHMDCTHVRTGILFYTIPNRSVETGSYEQFIDELSKRWNENRG